MPSINLIWEHRALRQRNQTIASSLLVVIVASVVVMIAQVGGTISKRRECQAATKKCDERIRVAKPLADRNKELQAEITAVEPLLSLMQEAQHVTLRWVSFFGELDRCVPDPKRVAFNQCSFAAGASAASAQKATPGLIGNVTLAGVARGYPLITETMRRLALQRHVGDVRVSQGQQDKEAGIVRFTVKAQLCIPEDEATTIAGALQEQSQGRDYAAMLEKAGDDTVLSRVPPKETASQ